MRVLCMFDLPMDTSGEKKAYRVFRKNLISEGFVMMQYSIYVRVCPNRDFAERLEKRIRKYTPEKGNIRILMITEKQYEDIKLIVGSKSVKESNMAGTERMICI